MSTSYANPGGSGNRTGSGNNTIAATATIHFSGSQDVTGLVDGNFTNLFFFSGEACAGLYMRFQILGLGKQVINEMKWYQTTSDNQGTWQIQGSQNGSSWTDIGSPFVLGGTPTQVITAPSGNNNGYIYYQLIGVSGSTTSNPWTHEIEFKIGPPDTGPGQGANPGKGGGHKGHKGVGEFGPSLMIFWESVNLMGGN